MEWKLWFDSENGIVCIQNKGRLTLEDLKIQAVEASHCMDENDSKRVLVDDRNLKGDIKLFSIYELPKFYSEMQIPRGAKIAILNSKTPNLDRKERFDFFETVCVNAGYNVKIFTDEDAARQWLLAA